MCKCFILGIKDKATKWGIQLESSYVIQNENKFPLLLLLTSFIFGYPSYIWRYAINTKVFVIECCTLYASERLWFFSTLLQKSNQIFTLAIEIKTCKHVTLTIFNKLWPSILASVTIKRIKYEVVWVPVANDNLVINQDHSVSMILLTTWLTCELHDRYLRRTPRQNTPPFAGLFRDNDYN